jgi:hypothetical protein
MKWREIGWGSRKRGVDSSEKKRSATDRTKRGNLDLDNGGMRIWRKKHDFQSSFFRAQGARFWIAGALGESRPDAPDTYLGKWGNIALGPWIGNLLWRIS